MEVKKIHATRMQIEEIFRDVKSARYGFAFDLTYKTTGSQILLLIVMLALFVLLL